MTKSIHEMTQEELANIPLLELDDSFPFACRSDCGETCGKCCKNRNDLLLTGWDVFRLARHFKCTPDEIILKYCELYQGHESKLPVVRLIPKPYNNTCPFLKKGKCSLHYTNAKPDLCRSFPLAKVTISDGKSGFYLNTANCGVQGGTSVVRDWVGDIASNEGIESSKAWSEAIGKVFPVLQKIYKNKSHEENPLPFTTAWGFLYLIYDTSLPFAEQCRKNIEIFLEGVGKSKTLI